MANLVTNEVGVTFDNLIGGTYRTLVTKNVKLKSDTKDFKRGMVLVDSGSGEYQQAASSDTGKDLFVLAEDVSIKGEAGVATVYVDGVFNREALQFKDNAPTGYEAKLAGVLTSVKGGK